MAIEVKNLTKTYKSHKKEPGFSGSLKSLFHREVIEKNALTSIDFSIGNGEFVGLIGENGAGKTTLIKILSGIIFPTSGTAEVLGYKPWERKNALKKQFSVVMGQKNQLWWDLPAYDSFLLLKEIYEVEEKQFKKIVSELSEILDMKDKLYTQVRKLSLGERMKAELIAALLHSPKVLYLDEPTIGLDVLAQESIRKFLKTYNSQAKTTIILTSHYMDDIETLCKRVIILDKGILQFDGSLEGVIKKYANEKVISATLGNKVELEKFTNFGTILNSNELQVEIKVERKNSTKIASELLNNFPIVDITIKDISIEEIIKNIFRESK
ncbi:ATP-binding cassette domain-containing protein [bacterium]|nr:ATP-binding cassette domain-containing protein [bacterium]